VQIKLALALRTTTQQHRVYSIFSARSNLRRLALRTGTTISFRAVPLELALALGRDDSMETGTVMSFRAGGTVVGSRAAGCTSARATVTAADDRLAGCINAKDFSSQ
jgi:hypothetical protein